MHDMRTELSLRERGLLPSGPFELLFQTLKIPRSLAAEFLGTALLLAGIVGSGIMAERLANGNAAVALLANALATGFLLPVLILMFAPFSGAHFNPVVSAAEAFSGRLSLPDLVAYAATQVLGAVSGVWLAHAMFAEPILQYSGHVRAGWGQWISETVAAFGLVLIVLLRKRFPAGHLPWMIGAYIASAYFFTASTSFANPAVTLARSLTNTFSGIRPLDVSAFVAAQCVGTLAAWFTAQGFNREKVS